MFWYSPFRIGRCRSAEFLNYRRSLYIYIYIYRERERDWDMSFCGIPSRTSRPQSGKRAVRG